MILWNLQIQKRDWICAAERRDFFLYVGRSFSQSMKRFGSVQWITNPVQSSWIWTGLDQEITHIMDSGLDWIQEKYFVMPGMYFLKAEQNDNACHSVICRLSLCDRTLTVILEAFQVHKYITFLDWTGLVQSLPVRPGLDWIRIAAFGSGLVWTPSSQSISYSGRKNSRSLILLFRLENAKLVKL